MLLRMQDSAWLLKSDFEPHLTYANIDFNSPKSRRTKRRLLRWVQSVVGFYTWPERRLLNFLQTHQNEFRRCLAWLSKGAIFNAVPEGEEIPQEEWTERWKNQPELQFLQLHGLDHSHSVLQYLSSDGPAFFGLELAPDKVRDPLDPFCWHMLVLLMRDGRVPVQQCKSERCGRFFRARTARRQFCSDQCRSNHHMTGMTAEEKRERMRDWRSKSKRYPSKRKRILLAENKKP